MRDGIGGYKAPEFSVDGEKESSEVMIEMFEKNTNLKVLKQYCLSDEIFFKLSDVFCYFLIIDGKTISENKNDSIVLKSWKDFARNINESQLPAFAKIIEEIAKPEIFAKKFERKIEIIKKDGLE
jgi:hypothetical protein